MQHNLNYWVNLDAFSLQSIILCAIGWLCWISLYVYIAVGIRKNKYVEMPWVCVIANFTWEFLWGFIFYESINEIGHIFVYSYRAWCILDIYILWGVFKYGKKQIDNPEIKKYFVPFSIMLFVMWGALFGTFIASPQEFDVKWGSQSAYILNVVISVLFISLFLRQWKSRKFSKLKAYLKGIGTLAYTIAYFEFDPTNLFVHTIGFVVLGIDIVYLYFLYTKQPKGWTPELQTN